MKILGAIACVSTVSLFWPIPAWSEINIFECQFEADFQFVVTVYDDGTPDRIGVETGVGDIAKSYFDEVTKAWVIVEFVDQGHLPSTLTTILANGDAWHSRHTLDSLGGFFPSQMQGTCRARIIS